MPFSSLCDIIADIAPASTPALKEGKKTSRNVRSERSAGEPLVPLIGSLPATKCLMQARTSFSLFKSP
jgi:hypothetical protein